ncbi:VOC family protein [Labilibacter marinus]|uniref:VOC family protein n=1 Tax=Labilibacter marinus TaxID=1477105 RepID=UPI00082C5A5D|nr:VOC family protein [Labilibacter marinus]
MTKLISWVEIPCVNFNQAVSFYSKVLKVDLQVVECEQEKMACFPGGEGAISYAPNFKPSKNGALVSFNVEDDMDRALQRISDHGGSIIQGKTKIEAEGRGYFAIFIDSEGNRVGLYGNA